MAAGPFGWAVAPADVLPVPDVLRGLEIVLAHRTAPGRPVILPTPAYMPFLDLPGLCGREIIDVPATRIDGRPALDLDGIDAAFRAGGELLVLTNPHNPLGRVFTADELRAVCEVVDRHGGRVFADEIHAPLTYPGHRARALRRALADGGRARRHRDVGVQGLEPARAGVRAADPLQRRRPGGVRGTPDGGDARHVATRARWRRPRRTRTAGRGSTGWWRTSTATGRPSRNCSPSTCRTPASTSPEGTYLAWLDLRAFGLGDHPAGVLQERTGVALVDGPLCGAPGRGHARLNFATPRPILAEMVRRLGDA